MNREQLVQLARDVDDVLATRIALQDLCEEMIASLKFNAHNFEALELGPRAALHWAITKWEKQFREATGKS